MPKVGLFVTCLVDLFRPAVGFATVKLLTSAGCEVVVPESQTCCGQPAFNSGDRKTTTKLAKRVIEAFTDCEHMVLPSGSCAGMIRQHYPELFAGDPAWRARAEELAGRTWELTSFMTDVLGVTVIAARYHGTATYHAATVVVVASPDGVPETIGRYLESKRLDPGVTTGDDTWLPGCPGRRRASRWQYTERMRWGS